MKPIYKEDIYDKLIDIVHDYTIADLPRNWRGDQPDLFIKDLDELKEEMKKTMREYVDNEFDKLKAELFVKEAEVKIKW